MVEIKLPWVLDGHNASIRIEEIFSKAGNEDPRRRESIKKIFEAERGIVLREYVKEKLGITVTIIYEQTPYRDDIIFESEEDMLLFQLTFG